MSGPKGQSARGHGTRPLAATTGVAVVLLAAGCLSLSNHSGLSYEASFTEAD